MIEVAALVIFPILMALAASSDLFTMTISNRISLALLAGFLLLALLTGMPWQQVALNISCGAAILVLTFGLFCAGWIGGGDAKLAAASALWIGWEHMLDYGLVASLAGGALTLIILQLRGLPLPIWAHRMHWLARLHDRETGVPYGIALAAAGLFVYPETHVWLRAVGVHALGG